MEFTIGKIVENRNSKVRIRYSTDPLTFYYALTTFTLLFEVAVVKVIDFTLPSVRSLWLKSAKKLETEFNITVNSRGSIYGENLESLDRRLVFR